MVSAVPWDHHANALLRVTVPAAFERQHCRFERIVRKGKWVTCLARTRS